MNFDVRRITSGPKHHLFGFHDLVQTNAKGDFALSLEVDDISHPPLPGESCLAGVVDLGDGQFKPIHSTHTWNYPQGARQQWIGASDLFACNDRDESGRLICRISDARARRVVETLPFPIHCINSNEGKAFFFNYDRIHAMGGYGYTPARSGRIGKLADFPLDDGVFIGDMKTGKSELLVSLNELSTCGEPYRINTGMPQYATHGMLNPSGTRLCFVHRYRVQDGGDIDRIMTVGIDGRGLRCVGKGFLSHFTWLDDETIFIWGEDQRSLCAFRESPLLRIPGVLQGALLAKRCVRLVRKFRQRGRTASGKEHDTVQAQGKAFSFVKDIDHENIQKTALGVLIEDGHPMSRPGDGWLVVNDTYPNRNGDRTLMFYDAKNGRRQDVGVFRKIDAKPDISTFDWSAAQAGIDPRVLKQFNRDDYLFFRSGYHCDLHPRWSYDGRTAYFDSIHEGTRQIYAVDYSRG